MVQNKIKVKYGTSFYDWSQMEGNVHGKKLMDEWNRDKNIFELRTNSKKTSFSTTREVWWICSKCGKNFKAAVCKRVHNNLGCPYCSKKGGSSIPEQVLFDVFRVIYPKTVNRDRQFGFEIDIFIPELNLGVEYNGSYFHKTLSDKTLRDRLKAEICKERGITLIQVWDDGDSVIPVLFDDGRTIKLKYRANRVHEQMALVSQLIIDEVIRLKSIDKQHRNIIDNDINEIYTNNSIQNMAV